MSDRLSTSLPDLVLRTLDAARSATLERQLVHPDERSGWADLCRTRAEQPDSTRAWAIELRGSPIGAVALLALQPGFAEIGFLVGGPHRGHGHARRGVAALASHAFGRLGVHRLAAATPASNPAAARVLEGAAFHLEGLMRGACFDGMSWRDSLLYARLSTDGGP